MTQLESHRRIQKLMREEREVPHNSLAACILHAMAEDELRRYQQETLTIWERFNSIVDKDSWGLP